MAESDAYQAYLLRLWRVQYNGTTVWRAAIENAHSRERYGFANLDELIIFLRQQTDEKNTDQLRNHERS
jgi:hypothetical protein